MKSVVLILFMTTSVIGYEQIFAINAGGEAHTDADGIVYKEDLGQHHWGETLNIKNVPESDRTIYKWIQYSENYYQPIKYDIPVKNEGHYLLIAKFSYYGYGGNRAQSMTLNNEIQLHSSVDLFKLCGGARKICDEYFNLCVTDNTVYFKNHYHYHYHINHR
jgi:Malectin domain